jgi:serine/threonine protein kinase
MQTPTLLNNRYRVIRVLGSGGFGETFLAEDTQMPSGRRCVIKKLKPVANNPQIHQLVQERFQREAAILEELGNGCNQIPQLYAYFLENDDFYLVQEYIEGETLQQKVAEKGLLSESSVREILSSILQTLEYVHSKRIVHRDIKPENILIRHIDGQPVLIDFGAVKETMGTVVNTSGESTRSIVIGTPGFMPSEQSAGRPVFASDLYSLGLTAIYALTGKIPQQLETDPATGDFIWRQYALSISPSFATFLDQAIASHPRDRYPNAREMLQSLQNCGTIPPTIAGSNPTLVSAPPNRYVKSTVVSPTPQTDSVNQGMADWQKSVIMGGVIGLFLIGGLWLTRPSETNSNNPTSNESNINSDSPLINNPVTSSNPQTSEPNITTSPIDDVISSDENRTTSRVNSLGWIRIGAVNNTVGVKPGQQLIPTMQPVTISPPVVPSKNNQVTVINPVNLRISQPQPPEYKLANSVGVVQPGVRVVIQELYFFQDPNSPFPYTFVWAKIGVPN